MTRREARLTTSICGRPLASLDVRSGERVEEIVREIDCSGEGRSGRMNAVYVFVAVVIIVERVEVM